jgi:hypothetical protein
MAMLGSIMGRLVGVGGGGGVGVRVSSCDGYPRSVSLAGESAGDIEQGGVDEVTQDSVGPLGSIVEGWAEVLGDELATVMMVIGLQPFEVFAPGASWPTRSRLNFRICNGNCRSGVQVGFLCNGN